MENNVLILRIAFDTETEEEANEFTSDVSDNIMDYGVVTEVEGLLNPELEELDKAIADAKKVNRVFEGE